MENEPTENYSIVLYRLEQIEQQLSKLSATIVDNALQTKELQIMGGKMRELENAINAHDQRIRKVEILPEKSKAEKYSAIIDAITKIIITVAGTFILIKLGLR